jgi:regulator of RNase E activity RraA
MTTFHPAIHDSAQEVAVPSALTRERLSRTSTATLTTLLFKHGFRNCFLQGPRAINPAASRFVGPAYTLRYIPAREDLDHVAVFEDPGHPQRRAVEEIPTGHVMVIDSRGDARAASAGSLLLTRLMRRGCAGVVTDGGLRDTPDLEKLPFPAFHLRPSAPTNLILHHAVDVQVPIACGSVAIFPGDIMVGDGEGVVCIPAHFSDRVAEEAVAQTVYEAFVQERLDAGEALFGLYPLTDPDQATAFAAWKAARAP